MTYALVVPERDGRRERRGWWEEQAMTYAEEAIYG